MQRFWLKHIHVFCMAAIKVHKCIISVCTCKYTMYIQPTSQEESVHVHVQCTRTCTCIISYRDKANASNDTRRQLFFSKRKRRAASGGTRTHDVLHSRQMLYQLSHRGSSAGRTESLKFIQGKWHLSLINRVTQPQH